MESQTMSGGEQTIHSRQSSLAIVKWVLSLTGKRGKTGAILTVYGDAGFNSHLSASAPGVLEVRNIQQRLRNFRSKPRFDILLYWPHQLHLESPDLLEDLCYCRMLLRPGGTLVLMTEKNSRICFPCLSLCGKEEKLWLQRAGFAKTAGKIVRGRLVVHGQRPEQHGKTSHVFTPY